MKTRTGLTYIALAALSVVAVAKTADTIPSQMVGEWRWGNINPTTFYDKSNGAYLGHGGGMSCYFIFRKDGSYKKYFYVEQSPTAGWTTKVFSESEGKLIVSNGVFTLKAAKGRFISQDNRVSKYNFDRTMTEDELKKEAASPYGWKMSQDSKGRTVMMIAPGAKGEGSQFQQVK